MSRAWPRSAGGQVLAVIGIVVLVLIAVSLVSWAWYALDPVTIVEPPPAPIAMLELPIPDGPQAAMLRHGRGAVIAGDCVSCHTRAGGHLFEGGLGLRTPFGTIYTPNLTGDRATGIGDWTPDQFYRAITGGVGRGGKHLYPALPYDHFTIVSRADSDAMLAWLKTVPARSYTPPANRLPFPLDIRAGMIVWNALFFRDHAFRANATQSAAWNRGAYLVQGLGHCGACHTARNALGAAQADKALQGAALNQWVAPDLTGNPRTGLGRWSAGDIVEYLKTGRNAHSNAAGTMAEVVSYSTSQMRDADLQAIATYLKTLPADADANPPAPDPAAMRAGAAIYADACTACHRVDGVGAPCLFPALAGSAVVQQPDPASVIHLILGGGRTAPTPTRPSYITMPSFAWKLNDQQIADVATYVRNSWGNRAAAVSAGQVAKLRGKLNLRTPLSRP